MSAVVILTPIVIASWPAITSVAVGAAASLGFAVAARQEDKRQQRLTEVSFEVDNMEAIGQQLGREKELVFVRDGVRLRFCRDARGQCEIRAACQGMAERELKELGETLAQRVVQRYVHAELVKRLGEQDFLLVEQKVAEDKSIRLRLRRYV